MLKVVASEGLASRISPMVTMPTILSFSTTGKRLIPFCFMIWCALLIGVEGDTVTTGLVIQSRTLGYSNMSWSPLSAAVVAVVQAYSNLIIGRSARTKV